MKTIKQRFEEGYLLGCIKLEGTYSMYLMPIGWWILNYRLYDPKFDPREWKDVFRNNILNVEEGQVVNFIKSIAEDKIGINELKGYISDPHNERIVLYFFVDFDSKLFVNGFSEVELELYLPDDKWKGVFEDTVKYLPEEMKALFR